MDQNIACWPLESVLKNAEFPYWRKSRASPEAIDSYRPIPVFQVGTFVSGRLGMDVLPKRSTIQNLSQHAQLRTDLLVHINGTSEPTYYGDRVESLSPTRSHFQFL